MSNDEIKFMLKQILDILQESQKKTDDISKGTTENTVTITHHDKIIEEHSKKMKELIDEVSDYNNQLSISISKI